MKNNEWCTVRKVVGKKPIERDLTENLWSNLLEIWKRENVRTKKLEPERENIKSKKLELVWCGGKLFEDEWNLNKTVF